MPVSSKSSAKLPCQNNFNRGIMPYIGMTTDVSSQPQCVNTVDSRLI